MKIKENIKRFFTLSRAHDGFTLVELIVVIAILAILAGVAVPAYSGYITRTNKTADQKLAAEVADALIMHYYNNAGENMTGYVVLTPEGQPCLSDNDGNGVGDAAMVAVFGEGWEDQLSLKYSGWKGTNVGADFSGSTFDGNLDELFEIANDLSGTLANFLTNYEGSADGFFPFLEKLGIDKDSDPTSAANAAVLYVGEAVKKADQEKVVEILCGVPAKIVADMNATGAYDINQIMLETSSALQSEMGGSTMAAAAVMYAYAESYALATGQTIELDESKITNGSTGLAEVRSAFAKLMDMSEMTEDQMNAMIVWGGIDQDEDLNFVLAENAPYKKDAQAVMSTMSAVNNASDTIKENLHKEDMFLDKTTQDLVNSYLTASVSTPDGCIMIMINNGTVMMDPAFD